MLRRRVRSPDGDSGDKTTPDVREGPRRLLAFWEGGQVAAPLPPGGILAIGRSVECEAVVDHASVSRKHVLLHIGPPIEVEDLGSSNGTRVAGKRILPHVRTPIQLGEVIEIGSAMLVLQAGSELSARTSGDTPGVTLRPPPPAPPSADGLVVRSEAMERAYRLLELVAQGSISVLLLGETGVGKEVAAEAVHQRSPRRGRPWVVIHCAAMPEQLLESELFGYERGAFTGALQPKPGMLETAHGGTVFLDEVGDLPLATQAKLLRVVETRQVTRLGGLAPKVVDVRFVSATNKSLEAEIRAGTFRQDLFFRLSGVTVTIPPLRDRREEIEPLAALFAARAAAEVNRPAPAISIEARSWLQLQPWPGNVRQLRNVVERAVLLCRDSVIGVEHLDLEGAGAPMHAAQPVPAPPGSVDSSSGEGLRSEMEVFERERIADALRRCNGNQTLASKMLGISRRTLIERLDAYDLPRPRKKRTAPG